MTITLDLVGRVLLGTMFGAGLIQVLYHWLVFSRFAFLRKNNPPKRDTPISVIVCARNESKNLQKNLPLLLDQDHPDYELIVVNDCSWDDTEEFLKEFAPAHPRLKVVTIQEQERYSHGKKFAITLGIKAAKNERMLFTDADCWPTGRSWISSMSASFNDQTEIVLGYGGYEKTSGLLNRLIRFDTASIAMQYFSFAIKGNAYMGVGRNLAYRKTLFFRNKGFARHNHLASGDDDLLVNETATTSNVAVNVSPDAFTRSTPKGTWGGWFSQKKRHMTTSRLYRAGHRFQLSLIALSNWLLLLSFVASLSLGTDLRMTLAAWSIVWLLKLPIFALSASRLREKDLILLYILLEPIHVLFQPLPFIAQLVSKKRAWK
ncbi:MAG: glycosyltransferase [Bacteroidota bacterium]